MNSMKIKPGQGLDNLREMVEQGQRLFGELSDIIGQLQVKVDIPGVDPEDLQIDFEAGVIQISSKRCAPEPKGESDPGDIIAVNRQTQIASALVEQMAGTDEPVVIFGSIGTGKHLFARKIHEAGPRRNLPFIWLSCVLGQGPEYMAAQLDKAAGGTVYLDCMNELAPECFEVIKMVTAQDYSDRFRLIAGIGQPRAKFYRQPNRISQLFDQLHCCVIELPELIERQDEIEALAIYHLARLCCERSLKMKQLSPEFIQILKAYAWPGNVRELVNTLEQVIITTSDKKTLFARDLPNHIRIQGLKKLAESKQGL